MKFLITGSNGLLGQKLVNFFVKHNIPFVATSKGENRYSNCPTNAYFSLDIVDRNAVFSCVLKEKPTAIIHTAAITNVDYCESNPQEAELVNVSATGYLFEAAKEVNAHFQLLSTDFVFDGEKGFYNEFDKVNPLSFYAKSKVSAERILQKSNYDNWSIARTIIVYGTGENLSRSNLILWALEALPKGEEMTLVNDQFRSPTWADDLASGCAQIILQKQKGIFHLAGPVTRSVIEIVLEIAKIIGLSAPKIKEINSETLNQAAKRPPKTGFDLTKANNFLHFRPLDLKESIPLLLAEINYLKSNQ